MERIDSNHLGMELYPVDNSYSQDLTTGKRPDIGNGIALAGDDKTLAVKVKIVSEPFMLTVPFSLTTNITNVTKEFVIVEYNDKKYLILNNFTTKPWPLTN
jgi:hypothetical protein